MPLMVAEPPAAYAERPRLVVDASVLAAALFDEAGAEAALSWMRGRRLCAPHLLDCEIANVGLTKMRQNIDAGAVREAMRMHARSELDRYPVDAVEVIELALRAKLSAYDAAYLWLARTLGAPLATFDAKLGAAALRELRDG